MIYRRGAIMLLSTSMLVWTGAMPEEGPSPEEPILEVYFALPGVVPESAEAPEFSDQQRDLEVWSRYNSGFRYHDYNPATGLWQRRDSQSAGLTYAEDLRDRRTAIENFQTFPPLWGDH